MGANPEPDNQVAFASSHGPIRLVDSNRPNIAEKGFEAQLRVKAILSPNFELFPGQTLDFRRQLVVTNPKLGMCP
jgi:hypothetical protein